MKVYYDSNVSGCRHNAAEQLVEVMGVENLLWDIISAMSDDEAFGFFDFICRNHDIELLPTSAIDDEDEEDVEDGVQSEHEDA